jgi:serine/threonine-protein kinase
MRPQVGQVINNKYRLIRLIGDGGMGSVFEAKHEVLGTKVALKFLHPELTRRAGLVQRFLQEAKVSAQIESPHVVRVMDVDQTPQGLAFIVLEYLEGRSLQTLYEDLYRAGQRLSYADALNYAMQMLEGVEAAHDRGVVHRDLKPDNVMIITGKKGEPVVKVLDFGIAKLKVSGELERGLTRPGVIMGTPEYMAPEQAFSADSVDARADIFSLGVMFFEMIAGRRPVGGDEPQAIAASYLSGQVAKLRDLEPTISVDLETAIHKAMAPLSKDRWGSVAELRAAIEPFYVAVRPMQSSLTNAPGAVTSTPPPAVAASPPPPTNAPSSPSGVPKTIPPEADIPVSLHDSAVSMEPARPFVPATRPPTPLGGFSTPGHAPFGAPIEGGTVEATPLVFGPNPDMTAPAAPLPAFDRPGGTAMGGAPIFTPQPTAAGGMTAVGGELGPTAPMNPYAVPGDTRPTRPARKPPSLLLVIGVALGISGLAVGGVYGAHQLAAEEDHDTTPIRPPPPPATVHTDPPLPPDQTPTTPAVKPPPPRPQPPPPPHPTGQPTAQPTGQPTTQPSSKIPPGVIILPSSLPPAPTGFPIIIPGLFPPQQNPQGQPPAPTSKPSSNPLPLPHRPTILPH